MPLVEFGVTAEIKRWINEIERSSAEIKNIIRTIEGKRTGKYVYFS